MQLSFVDPYPDETLISFLSRALMDSCLRWGEFKAHVVGRTFVSARLAERHSFDWQKISAGTGVDSSILYAMSERSLLCDVDQVRQIDQRQLSRFPWLLQKGYCSYSPAALRDQFYWRRRWLRPDALVDETRSLMLRHCHHCLTDLGRSTWTLMSCECPKCREPLSGGPVVPAPPELLRFAGEISRELDEAYLLCPLHQSAAAFERMAV